MLPFNRYEPERLLSWSKKGRWNVNARAGHAGSIVGSQDTGHPNKNARAVALTSTDIPLFAHPVG